MARPPAAPTKGRIRAHRRLGRTGFQVSDLGFGCGRMSDPALVRYAVEKGVNILDTADSYGNGLSERAIGAAMPHLQRDKIFLVTKLKVTNGESEQSILDRFARSLERLRTGRVDALYMHSVTEVEGVKHPGFHAAIRTLRAAGKVKHAGLSCHGPRGKGDSMQEVMLAAVEDGRFDVMLLVHSFMNHAEGARVLRACQEKQVGTTLMKTKPARLKLEPFNPESPSDEHARLLALIMKSGATREAAVKKLEEMQTRHRLELEKHLAKTVEASWRSLAVQVKPVRQGGLELLAWQLPYRGTVAVVRQHGALLGAVGVGDLKATAELLRTWPAPPAR